MSRKCYRYKRIIASSQRGVKDGKVCGALSDVDDAGILYARICFTQGCDLWCCGTHGLKIRLTA